MSLTGRWWAFWGAVFGLPLLGLLLLIFKPAWDANLNMPAFHFYIVSATALAAAVACGIIISLTQSLRETRLVFLSLAFLSIAAIFSVHGLLTPGHIHHEFYPALALSSWLSVFTGAVFIALSVVALPGAAEAWVKEHGGTLFGVVALVVGLYVGISVADPEWLNWVPIENRNLQLAAAAITFPLLAFGAWRYFQAFLFARLLSQWAMVAVMLMLIEVQVSLAWGRVWHYSWWFYHATYGLAFLVLFAGWFVEVKRAGTVRVIAEALSMRDAMAQLSHGYSQPIADLVDAIEWKDLYTLGHVRRVASFAVMIGKECGLSALDLRALALAAQMHDVGKISVPDRILTKPARLTPEEFMAIKEHVVSGYDIALKVPGLKPAIDGIRYHHERVDGTGYPEGLKGDAIPLQARIVAVADAFDAMTSGRSYQPAVAHEAALAELRRCAGSHFDPACVSAFETALAKIGQVASESAPIAPQQSSQAAA